MQTRTNLIIPIAVAVFLCFQCAQQAFPPGGPVDKRPPFIIFTIPEPGATHVPLDTKVEIHFSERVQKSSAEEAIFITPNPGRNLKYQWRGKRLQLKLPGKLRPERTYVITIGTGTKDMRNNAMSESFSLAYSTGAELDRCEINGKVYSEGRVEGTQIWVYDLSESSMPNPSLQEPLYVTQCGAQGDFLFTNTATGHYRIFAVIDRDMNQAYDPEYDALGVTSKDVELSEQVLRVDEVNFKLAIRDTTKPALVSASATDRHHIDLRFSESLSPQGISDTTNFAIISASDSLRILKAYLDERSPSFVHLVTSEQKDSTEYTVKVEQLWDLSGHSLDSTAVEIVFQGVALPDTVRPRVVSISPMDSSAGIALDSPIEVIFSEPMEQATVETGFVLSDSLGNHVPGSFSWPNGTHVIFQLDSSLQSLMTYSITMPVDSVLDMFGNSLSDTLFYKIFTTLNQDTLSEISGMITDADSMAHGTFYMTAKSMERGGGIYETQLQTTGAYVFPDILPGVYQIEVFRDEDDNRRYSFGEAIPFVPAERFYVCPDSIKVRSRWPNEGNDIVLPK